MVAFHLATNFCSKIIFRLQKQSYALQRPFVLFQKSQSWSENVVAQWLTLPNLKAKKKSRIHLLDEEMKKNKLKNTEEYTKTRNLNIKIFRWIV